MKSGKSVIVLLAMIIATMPFAGCKTHEINTDQDIMREKNTDENQTISDVTDSKELIGNSVGKDDSVNHDESENEVDVIFFMGEANMSGLGGDASLAPVASADSGVEFRAVSDPARLYPIVEPFGENENVSSGVSDYSGAKKGSLVSAFANEYHKQTGRRVVAVSVAMASADMDVWTSENVMADVKQRYDLTLAYLGDNLYEANHVYVVWFQGETDGLKGSAESTYRNSLDEFMKPLFKDGLEKVFIITPGRTIDYTDAYKNVINAQIDMCVDDNYFALATTVLTKVSTECMADQYQYNQHALNYVGTEAAKSVAYYTLNGVEKIIYDYKDGKWVVPNGVMENSQEKDKLVYPSDLDINRMF